MNEVEVVEGGHYKMQWIIFTDDLYIIKICKIKHWFRLVDWIVYKTWKNSQFEQTMALSEFKKKVLYKVNK